MERTTPPGTAAGDGVAVGAGGPLGIGAVLRALREEFPDVTASKIRFLETEGLVEPRRSPSGHRWFSAGDVERLGQVLRMQRDAYLPLKVIKEQLDASFPADEPFLRPGASGPPGSRIGRAELLVAAEATEEGLAHAESSGLIAAYPDGTYDAAALVVLRLLADFAGYGIQPHRLRAAKDSAEHQATLIENAVASLSGRNGAGGGGHEEREAAARLAALSVRLHAAFLQAALRVRPDERPDGGDSRGE
ncbi:MerR-like DNA binding protein [Streptomyces sp. Amel2xB2]|uniref:transcriptional regulator FtsR n=1 Tax=Streptomyces sp. Amel2xB2 TaxID=1305829 RepID=UPI000DB9E38D|nr:MerR family transcriptional regulator [Streptomyces sp. Amel2xB2]RAJ57523.1 MerR-like DNA binding protein [Streptomyces sp. Amel2xB2]